MNRAATEDLRATRLWPVIRRVLAARPAPDALTGQAADILTKWSNAGGSKLDGDLDGNIDDPGAAIIGPGLDQRGQRRAEPGARDAHR